jgi:hypothetical protein
MPRVGSAGFRLTVILRSADAMGEKIAISLQIPRLALLPTDVSIGVEGGEAGNGDQAHNFDRRG